MFKLLCALIVGGFLGCFYGSGSYKDFTPEVSFKSTSNINFNKELRYKTGKTKSGESCKPGDKWDTGFLFSDINVNVLNPITKKLLTELQSRPMCPMKLSRHGFKHVCFLNIDTQQYRINDYERVEMPSGYGEIFEFQNTNKPADCTYFQYYRYCEYNEPTETPKCIAAGQCMDEIYEKNRPNIYRIIIGVIVIVLIVFWAIGYI